MSANSTEALRDAARREAQTLNRIRKALNDKRLVIIVGAGVTLNATGDASGKPLSRLTWTGLVRNGLDYLVSEGYAEATTPRIRRAYESLEDNDLESLLDAAGTMTSQMRRNNQLATWLEMVFSNLHNEIRHPAILQTLQLLHQKGAVLLTTNYDDLIERACGIPRIGRSNKDNVLEFRRGDLDGVFHVHGSYHKPQEIVLDATDYYKVTQSDEVQDTLKTFLECNTILFIGCGSGLEDPNFSALFKWASKRHENIPNRHCLLVRDGDNLNHEMMIRLKYGPEYRDLAPYLTKLLEISEAESGANQSPSLQSPSHRAFVPQDYEVGWVCAIQTEYVAASELLDEEHATQNMVSPKDENAYTFGRIGAHNVVIACLPKGRYGLTSAASVAKDMLRSFPIRFGLMVGIGGGAPTSKHDIRLGDVVVSSPMGRTGGVIHYEFGKAIQEKEFEWTGQLSAPPPFLLAALNKVGMEHERKGHRIAQTVEQMVTRNPRLRHKYQRPSVELDRLYKATFLHQNNSGGCDEACGADASRLVSRPMRPSEQDNPAVHYGLIASADRLMKDATVRDRLAIEEGVLCFEMEAAGLMDHFPCVVIRGICDYSDTHKNDTWQGYAAATAAAFAKELLEAIPATGTPSKATGNGI